jgi:hypothetical protein
MLSAFAAWTGPDLTGKCPDFDALSEASVPYSGDTLTGTAKLCYQKYISDGLANSDIMSGGVSAWKAMVQSQSSVDSARTSVQNNPGSLAIPQPGTTPVSPNEGLFTQLFHSLIQGATPVAQAAINYQMQQAVANKQPIHVPTPIVNQVASGGGMSSQTKMILWLAAGAVAVTVVLAFVLRKK